MSDAHDPEHATRHESHALTTYHAFLKDLERLGAMPKELAERAAAAVLSVLEQRILPGGVRHLEAQLPSKLRERLTALSQRRFGREALFRMVAEELRMEPDEAEPVVRAVFRAVRSKISDGEAQDVAAELPKDLAELWLNP
jgi:uncharacterized protein (DUF2267 family)